MSWEKPLELTKEEYYTVFECLRKGHFKSRTTDRDIYTYRESTNELVFMHFLPYSDIVMYDSDNETDTYYQVGPLKEEEQKRPEEMPRKIILENMDQVQIFLNEVSRLQKEYYDNSEEE